MLAHTCVGAKKQPKVYWVAVHPLQPQLVAVATNSGSLLLGLESLAPLPAAPLPLQSPSQVGGRTLQYGMEASESHY